MIGARLTKAGGGIPVPDGAAIRVHMRSAARIADFDNDARVLSSTYGTGVPVLLRVDQEVLRPEVFKALAGQTVGSTVVVPITVAEGSGSSLVYVELWIADIQDDDVADRVEVAVISTGLAEETRVELVTSLDAATKQRNGYAIRLVASAEAAFLETIESVREKCSAPAPFKVPSTGGADVHYILSESLHDALKSRIQEFGERVDH